MNYFAETAKASGFDWLGIVLIPIAISLIIGVYLGRLLAYQQTITSAVAIAFEFGMTSSHKTYTQLLEMNSDATTRLNACSLVLLAMKHREASAEMWDIATKANCKIAGYIRESASKASSDLITVAEWEKLNAAISKCVTHVAKRLSSIQTPWWNYFRFQLLTRKEMGIKGDDWPC